MAQYRPGRNDEVIELDQDLSFAFLRYADDLGSGVINPAKFEDESVYVESIRPDPLRLLRGIAQSSDLTQALEDLAPADSRYHMLRAAVQTMIVQAKSGGWGPPLRVATIKPGEQSLAAGALRHRLIATGDLPPEPELVETSSRGEQLEMGHYDDRLQGAVAKFQDRHGLTADGIAGPETLTALNQSLERRMAQAMLNLERLRWRSRQQLGRRIEVNQPAFRMTVFDAQNTPLHQARVVIGKREQRLQTPEFSDTLSYLVLNPTWTVPTSIMTRELLPEVKADAEFFDRNNMILKHRGKAIVAGSIDWATMTPEKFAEFGVVQKPGPGNAMGNVKFMFPNRHNIYLHDTPSKHLFANTIRAQSHGCVRVERPFALAWLLLSEQSPNPGEDIESILATGEETEVPLKRPIPIHLTYMTSWVDHAGSLQFREDVYDRDGPLARALQTEVRSEISDVHSVIAGGGKHVATLR